MKRIAVILMVAGLVLALVGCEPSNGDTQGDTSETPILVLPLDEQGTLIANSSLRDGPGSSFKEIGQLPRGASVHIIGTLADVEWYEIESTPSSGVVIRGFIPVKSVKLIAPGTELVADATPPIEPVDTLTYTPTFLAPVFTPTSTFTTTPELALIATPTYTNTAVAIFTHPAEPQLTGDANVTLVYGPGSASLINISKSPISVSGIELRRVDPQGKTTASFTTDLWTGVTSKTTALPPGDCLMINSQKTPRPASCSSAWGFITTSQQQLYFWMKDSSSSEFQVWKGDTLLQTCEISASACSFYLPQP